MGLWLLVAATGLAAWASFGANGPGLREGWWGLRHGVVGVYRVADADKTLQAGIVADPSAAGAPPLQQRSACVTEFFARGCNVPWVEVRLAFVFALSAALAAAGGALVQRRVAGRVGAIVLGAAAAWMLLGIGVSNGLLQGVAAGTNLDRAVVGVHRAEGRWGFAVPAAPTSARAGRAATAPKSQPFWDFYTTEQREGCVGREGAPGCRDDGAVVPLRAWLGVGLGLCAAGVLAMGLGYARPR